MCRDNRGYCSSGLPTYEPPLVKLLVANEYQSLLILDKHKNYISFQLFVMTEENGVTLLTIIPHILHQLQSWIRFLVK